MASKVKQSRKGRKRSGKNELVELAIQSENSEDATNSEELTSTQQKYVPVFGKPSRSTLKSQQDGIVEKSAKMPRMEDSTQLAEDLKLENVINKEEVSSENQSVKEVDSNMKIKDSSQEEDVMKRNNQSAVADETVDIDVCMIEVERCEVKEENYQEGGCHVEEAEGPEHSKGEGTSNEVAEERDRKEAQFGSLIHPQQDASCSYFEHPIIPEVSLNIDQASRRDTEVLEADSGKENIQKGTIDELQAPLNCQREAKINMPVDSSSERILKEEDLEIKETLLQSTPSNVKMEDMQKEDTCKFVGQAEVPTTNSINENIDNLNKLNSLTTEAKKMKGIEDTVSQDFKLVTEMSKILCDTISGTKISEAAATTEMNDGFKGNNLHSDTDEVIQEIGQRSQRKSGQNLNSDKIDELKAKGEDEIVVTPYKSEISSEVSKDLSKEVEKDLKSKDEKDIKDKGEQQQTNIPTPIPKLTDLVKFDDIECDKNDIWTDSQMDMLDEVITKTSVSDLPDTDMFDAVDLPVLVPQKTIDEYSNEGTLLMKGLIDELSSVTKNIVSMKRYIDSVKKQRQSRISVIWKNDKGNKN